MASELRVNTLKDAAGNNSVGMSYVANGSEKCWANFSGSTVTIRDSFNVSSLADISAGKQQVNYSSSAANTNYTVRNGSNNWHSLISNGNKTTSSNQVFTASNTHSFADSSEVDYGFLGDLA